MVSKVEAVIYLASQRGCNQTDWFRSYYTFNFGDFKRESRIPFGSLLAVNEHTLKEGRTLSFVADEQMKVLLLPVEGELYYKSGAVEGTVDAGQVSYIAQHRGAVMEITNRYTSRAISFLQICVRMNHEETHGLNRVSSFDIESDNSQLVPLLDSLANPPMNNELFHIGKLRGRHDVVYQAMRQDGGIFVYEIAGTCEVHDRLLLPGDALSIKNASTIDLEALTHEAIVLIAEIPLVLPHG